MRKYGTMISMFLTEKINFKSPSFNFLNFFKIKIETFNNVWFLSKNKVCAKYGTHKRYKINLVTLGPLGPSLRAPLRLSLRVLKWRDKELLRKGPFLRAPLIGWPMSWQFTTIYQHNEGRYIIYMSKSCANIFSIQTTSNYLWASEVSKN